ncbi:MAG: hypothetical protein PW792_17540 [Acidobacteriaceae bacterium]|nr:hypothetical protein [Acidobacteriaceae bacterium]
MAYLLPAEYAEFGLEVDTADAWVAAASAMIEAHCRRPSLLETSYTERLRMGAAQRVTLSYGPVSAVTAVRARYVPRRDGGDGVMAFGDFVADAFALHGAWTNVELSAVEVYREEVSLTMCALGMRYSEVEVTYTAGLAVVPDAVKIACAQVVKNAQAVPALNVKSTRLDTLQTEYFSDALLDTQVREMLRPYVAERMG